MSLTDASQAAVGAAITVLILTIALVAPLVYVAFYATNFTFFQKVVVVLVSLILAVVGVGGIWIVFGGGRGVIRAFFRGHQPRGEIEGVRVLVPPMFEGIVFSLLCGLCVV